MELVFILAIGLAIGSFLNVCIARIPDESASIVAPRSRCPKCGKSIAAYDNIPVLSYLLLRGKCRFCRNGISIRYPAVEILTAGVGFGTYLKFGFSFEWAVYFCFSAALIVLAFIDVDHRILPDSITLNGVWLGLAASVVLARPDAFAGRLLALAGVEAAHPRLIALCGSLLGVAAGAGLLWAVAEAYFRLKGVEGMGFGDVKMMAMVGAFLGAPLALLTIMLGAVSGSIVGLTLIQFGGKSRDYELPFGTFLGFAAVFALLSGDDLIRWYMERLFQAGP